MSNLPEIDLPVGEDLSDRLARFIAVMIAFATLVAALVGFLQSSASEANGDADRRAQQLGVEALASLQRAQQSAQVDYQTYALLEEERARSAAALSNSFYLGEKPDAARLQAEQAIQEQLIEQAEQLTSIRRDSPDGPENDPAFPSRFLARVEQDAVRLGALQDAANEEGGGWAAQESVYTAILAMLAVTLYLFGLALTVRGERIRRGFTVVGVGLVAAAVGWAGLTAASAPRRAPPEAAEAFAAGHVALRSAVDQQGFAEAVTHYDRAIELWPTFARAYRERGDALFAAGSPQRVGGFLSLAAPEALEGSTRDLRRAAELGFGTAGLYNNLGFHQLLQGIQAGSQQMLDEAMESLRESIERDPGNAIPHYNLGVALLASNRVDDARHAFDDGVRRTVYVDIEKQTKRGNAFVEEQIIAGALTDLETLLSRRPDLAPTIAEMKSRIVTFGARASLDPPPANDISVGDITLNVFPGQLQWQATLTGFDAGADVVSQQWYYNDPSNLGWQVLSNISGTVTPTAGTDGRHFVLSDYISTAPVPSCVPDGRYRLELYANGDLIAQGEQAVDFGDLQAFAARDLTVAVCHPPDWQRGATDLPGLVGGYASPDGTRGIYVFRLGIPTVPGVEPGTLTTTLLDTVVLGFDFVLPATPTADPAQPAEEGYFLGLSGSHWRSYDYTGGRVRAGAGLDEEGALIVAIAFGPADYLEGTEVSEILQSFTRYY